MFANPLYQQLHTKIVRYIAPYDAVTHSYSLDQAITFIRAAEAQHQQVLVAFYHSEYSPTRLPSVAHLPARRGEIHQALPQGQAVPVLGRGQPRQHRARAGEPVGGRGGPVLPGTDPRVQRLHGDRPGRARLERHLPDAGLHIGIQARDRPPADGHAEDLGAAQLLRHQPAGKLAHARTRARARRAGVADRDRRAGAIRRRLPQPRRLRPDTRLEGAQVHVRRCRLPPADQAAVHLRLDRRQQIARASTPG